MKKKPKTTTQKILTGLSNYDKPTPIIWRRLGDLGLSLILAIQGMLATAPEGTFTKLQEWIFGSVITIVLVLFKFFTNSIHKDSE